MIGQSSLLTEIKEKIENNTFPNFVILVGKKGSGKKLLLRTVLYKLNNVAFANDCKVDTIRTIIDNIYLEHNAYFVIPDADNMSLQAKNSLLKIAEECPNSNHIIMTMEDINNTLDTIKSRAQIYYMEEYTPDEIEEYVKSYVPIPQKDSDKFINIFKELCETPGEVKLLASMNAEDFYSYVEKVVDNITLVSGSNSFKIAEKISLKNEEDKYDLYLFWKAFSRVCVDRFHTSSKDEILKYAKWVQVTSESIRDLRITGINKQALFDVWLLKVREAWNEYNGD